MPIAHHPRPGRGIRLSSVRRTLNDFGHFNTSPERDMSVHARAYACNLLEGVLVLSAPGDMPASPRVF